MGVSAQEFETLLKSFCSKSIREKTSEVLSNEVILQESRSGFIMASPSSMWSGNHTAFIDNRIRGSRSTDEFDEDKFGGPHIVRFKYFCLGYLLGLFQEEKIHDTEFTIAEMQLPGFIALHLKELDQSRV